MIGLRSRLADGPLYYGWIISVLCFTALLSIYSINISFGVFFDYIIKDLETSRSAASIAFSLQTIFMYLSSAVVGVVVDRFGTRRLIFIGTIMLGIGMLGASQSTTLTQLFITYGMIAGTGMGIIYVIGFTLPSRWFKRRRGIATAIATSGVGIATLLAPPAAAVAIVALGWQETYLVLTAVAIVGLIVVTILISNDPASMGINAPQEFSVDNADTVDASEENVQFTFVRSVLTKRSFWLIIGSWIVIFLPFFLLIVHLVTYVTDIGMADWVGVWAISLIGGLQIPGGLLFGSVGDRVGRPATFVTLSLWIGALLLVLPFISVPSLFLAIAALYGLAHGGVAALITPLLADFYGSKRVTALYGISALSFAVAALAGPYLAGLSVETLGSYQPILFVSAVLVFVGAGGIHLASIIEDVDTRPFFT